MPFSHLTVVSVTGSAAYTEGSMWAIVRSCAELPGSKGLLISPNRPENLPQNIRHQPCKPFGYMEYSIFMIYSLAQYIDTDYCLVVQNDGWVLNGKNWRDEFWQYDYIGAPIMTGYGIVQNAQGQPILYTGSYEDPSLTLPLNGGFSLRSKRFLEMPRKLNISVPINIPNIISGDQPFHFDWGVTPIHSEDLFLTVVIRKTLEKSGLCFAPYNIASLFSFEGVSASIIYNHNLEQCLGHHFFRSIEINGFNSIIMKWPAAYFPEQKILPEVQLILNPFIKQGYNIQIYPI